jgi:hypothetical protein
MDEEIWLLYNLDKIPAPLLVIFFIIVIGFFLFGGVVTLIEKFKKK